MTIFLLHHYIVLILLINFIFLLFLFLFKVIFYIFIDDFVLYDFLLIRFLKINGFFVLIFKWIIKFMFLFILIINNLKAKIKVVLSVFNARLLCPRRLTLFSQIHSFSCALSFCCLFLNVIIKFRLVISSLKMILDVRVYYYYLIINYFDYYQLAFTFSNLLNLCYYLYYFD